MPSNLASIEETIKLNNELVLKEMVEMEERIAGKISFLEIEPVEVYDNFFVESREYEGRYIVSVADEIVRLLSTPIGSRVMRPKYGSELYKLRDRKLNDEWRLMAIKYTFVAINCYIKRVRCRKVMFEVIGDGRIKMKLRLEKR